MSSYPPGVTTATIRVGTFVDFYGDAASVTAKVVPVLGNDVSHIVHAATGTVMIPASRRFDSDLVSGIATFELPHTDAPGWLDPSGQTVTHWKYVVTVTATLNKGFGKSLSWSKEVQPLVGQTDIDLDLIPSGEVSAPIYSEPAAVLSLNGQTGHVVFSGDGATDAALAANLDAAKAYADSELAENFGDVYEPDIAFSVVDEDGRRTWIEAAPDGGPTEYAAGKIVAEVTGPVSESVGVAEQDSEITSLSFSVVDEDGRRTWIEADKAGKPSARALSLIAAGIGGTGAQAAPELVYPLEDWAHWGDSLTAANWGGLYMAPLTGRNHYNGGWGGQVTDQIAARQGGVPARVTLTNNTLPASGAVTLTAIVRTPLAASGSRRGSILGITGTLARDSGTVHTFTREQAGDAVSVPAGTVFVPEDGEKYRGRTVTIWTGRNGFKGNDPLLVVQSVRQMIDYLTPTVKRVIVMEVPPWEGEEFGVGFRPQLDALNDELRKAFPFYWLPIATWLRTAQAAEYAGITFTAEDQTDITNGITPRSLRSDGGHLNTAGNQAIAKRVHLEAMNRGWL